MMQYLEGNMVLSVKAKKYIETSVKISETSTKTAGSVWYYPSDFFIIPFPYSETGSFHYIHEYKNNRFIASAMPNLEKINLDKGGVPYGKYPRLILAYIASRVKKEQTRVLKLPRISSFLKLFEIEPTGSNIKLLRKQLKRLITCSFNIETEQSNCINGDNFQLVENYELWQKKCDQYKNDIEPELIITEKFYQAIVANRSTQRFWKALAVPFDKRILLQLKGSALEMDIYLWLNYKLPIIKRPVFITWLQLKEQFGANYGKNPKSTAKFKTKFEIAMKHVLIVYAQAKIDIESKGILLHRSKSSV